MIKRKAKSEPKKDPPPPIRVETKMIHGKMVEVKIYAAAYKPDDILRVNPSTQKKYYKAPDND